MQGHTKDADAAVHMSVLARLPRHIRERLLASAMRVELPAGAFLFEDGGPLRCGLMVSGLVRLFLLLPEGRQLTVLYDHAGAISGLVIAFGRRGRATGFAQAVTKSALLLFPISELRDVIRTDGQTAIAFIEEFADRGTQYVTELSGHVAGPLRERVGHHLLAIVAASPTPRLVADVTQQDIADATGAARESVTRVLKDLERKGIIRVGPKRIEIINPDAVCPSYMPKLRKVS